MALTPNDVVNKLFTVAFRGYSRDEVDAFLDEVESELTRLLRDNNALRLGGVTERGPAPAGPGTPAGGSAAVTVEPAAVGRPGTDTEPAAGSRHAVHALQDDVLDAPTGALRMLQLAQQTAEQLLTEARAEADTLRESARAEAAATRQAAGAEAAALRAEAESYRGAAGTEAEATLSAARDEAQRTLADASAAATGRLASAGAQVEQLEAAFRGRREAAEAELAERHATAVGDLDGERLRLTTHVEELRSFEQDHRARLRDYFSGQLRQLDEVTGDRAGAASLECGTVRQGSNGQPDPP